MRKLTSFRCLFPIKVKKLVDIIYIFSGKSNICAEEQGQYSQHFIFFVHYDWAQ